MYSLYLYQLINRIIIVEKGHDFFYLDYCNSSEYLPLAIDEFNGPRGDFYKNMFANCPSGRPGTADEVATVADLLLNEQGSFITDSDILIDGGSTASYFYGKLKPKD